MIAPSPRGGLSPSDLKGFHLFETPPLVLVIVRCLIKDFEARPSVTHLLEHPFIKQAHGKDVALRQQLAALVREQQEAGCKTRTK